MINIKNVNCDIIDSTTHNNAFIYALGYEQRSYFLFEKSRSQLNCNNTLVFVFDDYNNTDHTKKMYDEMRDCGFKTIIIPYENNPLMLEEVLQFIKLLFESNDQINIHFDYSSMPRSWYCKMPLELLKLIRDDDKIYFWYTEGEYPDEYEKYHSSGIDNFSYFSGKPSINTNTNRYHVLGLGYDYIRSQAISTVIDPSFLVACFAYPLSRKEIKENIYNTNKQLLSQAALTIALHIDDFSFMVAKLCEIINELHIKGDIILIPDGPKPLIMAISLASLIIKKEGISCMHMSRHSELYSRIDVTSTGSVYGFEISNK